MAAGAPFRVIVAEQVQRVAGDGEKLVETTLGLNRFPGRMDADVNFSAIDDAKRNNDRLAAGTENRLRVLFVCGERTSFGMMTFGG